MTSKEALETLFDVACNREHTNSEHSFWLKAYRVIKNDLEVLDIIKENHFEIDKDGNIYIGNKMDMMLGIEDYYKGEEESYNKIKECLENNK